MTSPLTESEESVTRDFNDPRYKQWRFAVFTLYNFECCMCKTKGGDLEAHHIQRWADNERLRYVVSNGACLCKKCHDLVTGNEIKYQDYFQKIVRQKIKEKKQKDKSFAQRKYLAALKNVTSKIVRPKQDQKTPTDGEAKPRRTLKYRKNPRSRF